MGKEINELIPDYNEDEDDEDDEDKGGYAYIISEFDDKISGLLEYIKNELLLIKEKNDKNTYVLILAMYNNVKNFLILIASYYFLKKYNKTHYLLLEKMIIYNNNGIKELKKVENLENKDTIVNIFEFIEYKSNILKKLTDAVNELDTKPKLSKSDKDKIEKLYNNLMDVDNDVSQILLWTKYIYDIID